MPTLDQISEAIGGLRSDVRHGLEKLDHIHECLHGEAGIAARVSTLEHERSFGKGKAAGIGAIGGAVAGAGVSAFWKTFAIKIGIL